jgi:PadR family transcriptional regulator PadR
MNQENTQAQMRKGILEFCILSILNNKEAYPSEILDQLKNAKMIVVEGTLYPLLTRLKNMEILTYRWDCRSAKKILRNNGFGKNNACRIGNNLE